MLFIRHLGFILIIAVLAIAQNPEPTQAASTSEPPAQLEPDASGAVPPAQIRALLLQAEEKDLENDKRLRDYTYTERQEEHKLDPHGNVAKTEIRTSEILQLYGEDVEKLISKDDKPLSSEEAKKEDEKIQKIIDKRKDESDEARRKRVEKEEKQREDDRKFVLEIADAFDFHLMGTEAVDGHDCWVLEGEPHPGYQPKRRESKMLSKFHGRVWIDKAEGQWVKLDITALDNINFGLFLARIHKGARIEVDLTEVNQEVWLPKHVQLRLDARVALLKNYREDIVQTFSDYKKFRTDTKMSVIGETQ
ncbi:MAG TPA: hypothetical protein VMI10_08855 [Terriglobales bacterium]|nr:hypothetical protein [Terriglobales bacterium]